MIIGKEGKNISENKAQEHVFGYCIVNDISERSWQKERGGQWIKVNLLQVRVVLILLQKMKLMTLII